MIGLVGLDHRLAGAQVRGRLALAEETLPDALALLTQSPAISGAAILSTCNRIEFYVSTDDWHAAHTEILHFLTSLYASRVAVPSAASPSAALHEPLLESEENPLPDEIARELYEREGALAAHHLLSVAAGLRSMVVGEAQVLGQVKDAMLAAEQAGTLDEELRALFTAALKAGKRVRSETELGRADVSVARLAMNAAATELGGLAGKAVLLVGAGRTSQLCAQIAHAQGALQLLFANRTPSVAEEIAREIGGEALPLADVALWLDEVDLLVSATAAPHIILSAQDIAHGTDSRARPLVLVDLAVPPDIAPEAADLPHITLLNLDTLRASTDGGTADEATGREATLARAEAIVDEGVREYVRTQTLRLAVPGITALRRHVDRSAQAELEHALARLQHLSPADQEVVSRLGQRLVDKMFHHLVARVRSLAEYDELPPQITMQVLSRLLTDPDGHAPGDHPSGDTPASEP